MFSPDNNWRFLTISFDRDFSFIAMKSIPLHKYNIIYLTTSLWVDLFFSFFYKFIYFIYLFLAELGFHCCMRAFSSCDEWGLLFVVVCGLLIAVASLVEEHGL